MADLNTELHPSTRLLDIPSTQQEDYHAGTLLFYSPIFKLWSIELYRKCSFRCSYCCVDAQGLSRPAIPANRIADVLEQELLIAERQYGFNRETSVLVLSCYSDPYTNEEIEHQLTREAIRFLVDRHFRFTLVTRSDLPLRDIQLFKRAADRCEISVSIPIIDPMGIARLEPHAPDPRARLSCVQQLNAEKIPVTVRIDPWIPGISNIAETLSMLATDIPVLVSPLHLAGTLDGFFVQEDLESPNTQNALAAMTITFSKHGLCRSTRKHFSKITQEEINEIYREERKRFAKSKQIKWFVPISPGERDISQLYRFLKSS